MMDENATAPEMSHGLEVIPQPGRLVIDLDRREITYVNTNDDVEDLFRDIAMTLDEKPNNRITLAVDRVELVDEDVLDAEGIDLSDLGSPTDDAIAGEEDTAEFSAARRAEPDPGPAAEPAPAPAARPKPTPAARRPNAAAKPAPAPRQ